MFSIHCRVLRVVNSKKKKAYCFKTVEKGKTKEVRDSPKKAPPVTSKKSFKAK